MRIVLITDAYPPLRSSAAVQLRDLSRRIAAQGHQITVMVASPGLQRPWELEEMGLLQILRLRTPKTKDSGYLRRTFAEFILPFAMRAAISKSSLANVRWDGVVWYSPTIFLGPLVRHLKQKSHCRAYLIIRDIFPEWAADMGLIGRGLPYWILKCVANYQYRQADVIGIQSGGNADFFRDWEKVPEHRLEVLHNWIAPVNPGHCSIDLKNTSLANRFNFVYAGNMGVAQNVGIFLEVANSLADRRDIGFVFVGRGSEFQRLKNRLKKRQLENVLIFDEIDADEIPKLYQQCHVGLVALDIKHKTHNIPGKFLTYMQAGLPVLAKVNPGNDLIKLIRSESVGYTCDEDDVLALSASALELVSQLQKENNFPARCQALVAQLFSDEAAAAQVIKGLQN